MGNARWAVVLTAVMTVLTAGCGTAPTPAPTPTGETFRATPTSTPEMPSAAPVAPRPETRALRVAVTDDTDGPLGGLGKVEVWVRGHGSWYPDLRFGGDVRTFDGFTLGKHDGDFFVYPDGRDGAEVRVLLDVPADMISGSVRDMVMVEIHRRKVVVIGVPIPDGPGGCGQEFKR